MKAPQMDWTELARRTSRGAVVDAAEVAQHSDDPARFRRMLPAARRLAGLEPGSPEWRHELDTLPPAQAEALLATVRELEMSGAAASVGRST